MNLTSKSRKKQSTEKPPSQNNGRSEDATGETLASLTGLLLTQLSCTTQFALLRQAVAQSNWVTPKTAEALSFGLSEMVSLTTNTSARLKTLLYTLSHSNWTSPNSGAVRDMIGEVDELLAQLLEDSMS